MGKYEFVSTWSIDASLDAVWNAVKDSEAWPNWWRGVVRVVELEAGDDRGVGAVHRSTWRSALPYTIQFDSEIVRIEELKLIEARAFGELEGTGLWQFAESGSGVRVQYDWHVNTTKPWMNLLAPLAKPLFRWNHDVIMRWGEEGLKDLLSSDGK
jgi:uncharacterized protein YndB with AHSA1/START domain